MILKAIYITLPLAVAYFTENSEISHFALLLVLPRGKTSF